MSEAAMPSQQDLRELLAKSTWVCLGPVRPGESYPGLPLDVRDEAALDSLRACLSIQEGVQAFHCMCIGDFAIELHDASGLLGVLTFHHGVSIRWDRWKASDALLQDGPAVLDWLASIGVTQPLELFREDERRREESAVAQARWLDAMPPSLRPVWRVDGYGQVEVEPLREALRTAYPDVQERILALLRWFGSGKGPWSGFPSYEEAVEQLLLDYPTHALLEALAGREPSPQELEGAARLFAGWNFGQQRSKDRSLIPPALRERLLEQALTSEDEDKRARARHAFDSLSMRLRRLFQ